MPGVIAATCAHLCSPVLTRYPCCSVTAWHRGGGAKRLYRLVDFLRRTGAGSSTVERVEYDPNRSARIALTQQVQGEQLPAQDLRAPLRRCLNLLTFGPNQIRLKARRSGTLTPSWIIACLQRMAAYPIRTSLRRQTCSQGTYCGPRLTQRSGQATHCRW